LFFFDHNLFIHIEKPKQSIHVYHTSSHILIMSIPPVRVGIIGLSKAATTSWASEAHLPNFLTEAGRERFQIVALCNTSVAKAEAAIQAYKLDPATTKAYGIPSDLAADPDVDLVLCSTRVDTHYAAVLPSLEAGKDVYIEWPIASNIQDTQRLLEAARKSGSGTIVGVQRRFAPAVLKVKELLDDGAIGKLLNVTVTAHAGFLSSGVFPPGLKYFTERSIGGNPITILVGHCM
jgi:predicted dehydrogenase